MTYRYTITRTVVVKDTFEAPDARAALDYATARAHMMFNDDAPLSISIRALHTPNPTSTDHEPTLFTSGPTEPRSY